MRTLKDHNEYMPPNGVDIFEKDWHTYFTFDAAVREFCDRLPNKEQLLEAIDSVPWDCDEKAQKLNIPHAGYRDSDGSWYRVGEYALLWSSSPYDSDYAWYVYLWRGRNHSWLGNWDRSYARSVRLLDTSETTSSLWLFDEVIEKLEILEKEKHMEADKIWEAIKLIRNLK